jgi:hypothetical protein
LERWGVKKALLERMCHEISKKLTTKGRPARNRVHS